MVWFKSKTNIHSAYLSLEISIYLYFYYYQTLTQANVGIAMGSGTNIAMSSGHVIPKADLYQILYALDLGKYSMKKIKQNLAMSFAYNFVTISSFFWN